MGNITQNTYILSPKVEAITLIKHGFYRKCNEEDEDEYVYRFPVLKHNNKPSLDCETTINYNNKQVVFDVYETGTNNKYAPFYHIEYGNFDCLLDKINKKIDSELKRNLRSIIIYKKAYSNKKRKKVTKSVTS